MKKQMGMIQNSVVVLQPSPHIIMDKMSTPFAEIRSNLKTSFDLNFQEIITQLRRRTEIIPCPLNTT